jgi:hypothetical protein
MAASFSEHWSNSVMRWWKRPILAPPKLWHISQFVWDSSDFGPLIGRVRWGAYPWLGWLGLRIWRIGCEQIVETPSDCNKTLFNFTDGSMGINRMFLISSVIHFYPISLFKNKFLVLIKKKKIYYSSSGLSPHTTRRQQLNSAGDRLSFLYIHRRFKSII